jgi:UDP-2,3-diacylglucosamine hydrolase
VNGDLFEFWFEWRTVIPRRSFRVLSALADLRDAGVSILMLAGNHDCWGGDVLREDVGVDYHIGPWEGTLSGWRTRIDHGDGLRPKEDRRYRALRRVLRNRFAIRAFRWIHPDVGTALASRSSHASRTYGARDQGRGLARIATATLAARPELELVIFGHSHVAALMRAPTGGVYANAGAWLDAPTYLRVTESRIELRRFDGSAEGLHLDALDRSSEKALA